MKAAHSRSGNAFQKGRGSQGFTLSEIMVSMAIMSFVIGGMYSFFMTFYKLGYTNEQKNLVNADMREVTGQLTEDGRQSNYFLLYESSKEEHRNEIKDRLTDGNSGDMIVFVYTDADDDEIDVADLVI